MTTATLTLPAFENVEALAGEIVDVANKAEARSITAKLHNHLENAQELVIEAFEKKVWIALGYKSWNAYVTYEFDGLALNPPKEDRVSAIAQYTAAGMSTRAISAVTGLSKATVNRAVNQAQDAGLLPDEVISQGLDGLERTYKRAEKPAEPSIFDIPADILDASADAAGIGTIGNPASKPVAAPAKKTDSAPVQKETVPVAAAEDLNRTGFNNAEYLMLELIEQVKNLVLGNNDENFSADQYSQRFVMNTVRALASTAHLLRRMDIQPDLFGGEQDISAQLETVVANLDKELARLRGEADV